MHSIQRHAFKFIAALIAVSTFAAAASACTGIRLRAEDGSVIYARTMEFGLDLKSNAIVIPRHIAFTGTTSSGQPGLQWKSKYAVAGLDGLGLKLVVDGVNEQGLAGGLFYFPDFAEYQIVTPRDQSRSIAPWEVVTWLLTNFATVDEARAGLPGIKVGAVEFPACKFVPGTHYVLHDPSGQSLVIEYVNGELKLYDNPVGVITNAPTFDWHLTNLRNYIKLEPTNVLTADVDGERLSGLGQGSGMLGLPGDFTPPSRFVRAAALSHTALPGKDGPDAVRQAFHVLDSFDIPLGTVRPQEGSKVPYEYTQWTSASDTKNRTYYFHSYGNRQIRKLDLLTFEIEEGDVYTFPLIDRSDIENLGGPGAAH